MAKTDCYVFASNELGVHGAGAAKTALKEHGAQYGRCYGHVGNSFAIPTKDEYLESLDFLTVSQYVQGFLAYAKGKRKLTFKVTRIGHGQLGFTDSAMTYLFQDAPANCHFPKEWKPYLGHEKTYWEGSMTVEQFLTKLYATRVENILRLIDNRQLTFTEFSFQLGRHTSFTSLLVQRHRTPHEHTMRLIEHTFGYAYTSMDREDFLA